MSIENFDCLDDTCVPIAECETVAEDYNNIKNPPSQAIKVSSFNFFTKVAIRCDWRSGSTQQSKEAFRYFNPSI